MSASMHTGWDNGGRDERRLRSARLAVAAVFFTNGAAFASWVVRIPAVQHDLGIGTGTLGLALLGVAAGAVLSMTLTGTLVSRFGSAPLVWASALLFCAALNLPALAPSTGLLAAFLVLFGVGNGALDVSMNAQAVAVERRYQRPIMSSFHAMFSVGGLVGAAAGGAVAHFGVAPETHLFGAALVLGVLCLVALPRLLPASADTEGGAESGGGDDLEEDPKFVRPSGALIALGLISCCVLFGEGAIADWSAVYLRDAVGTGSGLAAAGYAAFSSAMIVGRLSGDFLVSRLGSVRLVRLGGILAASGFGVALVVGDPVAAIVGFVCTGLGFSVIFPVTLSAAGRTQEMKPGPAIAAVSTTGYFGFLAGPPLIGFLGELVGIGGALGTVVLTSVTVVALAGTVGRQPHPGKKGADDTKEENPEASRETASAPITDEGGHA